MSHILIYTNKTINADKVQKYIDTILESNLVSFKKDEFYNKALHSKDNMKFDDEIGKFKKAPYGIISCVYIFGEGFDEPKLNGVLIAENMNSQIRIVQYILRANRLDKDKPGKISHVIINSKNIYPIIPCGIIDGYKLIYDFNNNIPTYDEFLEYSIVKIIRNKFIVKGIIVND